MQKLDDFWTEVEQVVHDVNSSPLQWRSGLGMLGSLSVCCREIWRTTLRILAKIDMELVGDELGTATRPDFPGKI